MEESDNDSAPWTGPIFRYLDLNGHDKEDLETFSAFSNKMDIESAKTSARMYLDIVGHKKDHWLVYLLSNCLLYRTTPQTFNDPFDCMVLIDPRAKDNDLLRWVRIYAMNQSFNPKDWQKLVLNKIKADSIKKYLNDDSINQCFCPEDREAFKEILQITLQAIVNTSRTICFSKNPNNILMWAHYSGKHEGYCLEFNALDLKAKKPYSGFFSIKYNPEGVNDLRPVTFSIEEREDFSFVKKIILTKSRHWSYEEEVRFICGKREEYYSFDPSALRRIILGAKMDENHKKGLQFLIEILRARFPHITFSSAELDQREFKVNIP